MKRFKLVILLISIIGFSFSQNETNRGYKVKVGDKLPAMSLPMMNGETWTNKDFENKVVIIQFTGSWCSVCRKEMPHLEKRIWQAFKNQDVLLIGIDIKDKREKADAFIKKMEVTYPIAYDPDANIFSQFTLEGAGVTRNIVVNKKGEIVFLTRLFEEKEFEGMIAKIKELI
jgi:peroxiredoxin